MELAIIQESGIVTEAAVGAAALSTFSAINVPASPARYRSNAVYADGDWLQSCR